MDALAITELITLLANFIYQNTSQENAVFLASVFTQLGDTILTISAIPSNDNGKC